LTMQLTMMTRREADDDSLDPEEEDLYGPTHVCNWRTVRVSDAWDCTARHDGRAAMEGRTAVSMILHETVRI